MFDDPNQTEEIRDGLLVWYHASRRDLPWRRSSDPYAIWVSEVMLQQTTVAAVTPYWERFVAAFPDLASLALADEAEVLRLWAGLGYYHRAKNLVRAARVMRERGDDTLPRDLAALRALPGIGEYTAAAIASIAFGVPEPVIDGNVVRVLTRLSGATEDPARQPLRGRLREWARALIDPRDPGNWNQALMELGATVCTPRAPLCEVCPVRARCAARQQGIAASLPRLTERRATIAVVRGAVLVRKNGRFLFARIPEGEPNAGLWEFPSATLHHGGNDDGPAPSRWSEALARALASALGARGLAIASTGSAVARCRHAITHHRITVHLVDAELACEPEASARWRWVEETDGGSLALTAATTKLWRAIERRPEDV